MPRIIDRPSWPGMPMSAMMIAGTSVSSHRARRRGADAAVATRAPRRQQRRSAARGSWRRRRRPAPCGRQGSPSSGRRPGCRAPAAGSDTATRLARGRRCGSCTVNAAPLPVPPLLDRHLPAVHLDEVLDDRQAEPEAAVRPREALVGLAEALEDVGQELGRRCPTPVSATVTSDRAEPTRSMPDAYAAAGRRELDGVREQVPEHLLQPLGVAVDDGRLAVDTSGQMLMPLASAAGRTRVHRVAHDRARSPPAAMSSRSRPVMMRDTSSTSDDQLRLRLRVALDDLQHARHAVAARRAAARSSDTQPRIALSGVRSSCDSVARNSSFSRLARSASSRAARRPARRSSATSTSRSSYWRRAAAQRGADRADHRGRRGSADRAGVTLRSTSSVRRVRSVAWLRSSPANSSTEMSDHAGCVLQRRRELVDVSDRRAPPRSGARRRRRVRISAQRASTSRQTWQRTPALAAAATSARRRGRSARRMQDAQISRCRSVGMQQALRRRRRSCGTPVSTPVEIARARLPTRTRLGPELRARGWSPRARRSASSPPRSPGARCRCASKKRSIITVSAR